MSSISAVGGSGDAWAAMRSQMQARMFAKSDSNSDGGVDKTELSSMLSDISKMTGQKLDGNIDDTFKAMDGNGDGTLSSDELGQGMEKRMPPPSTMDFAQSRGSAGPTSAGGSPIDDIFSKIDSNGDGSLDKSELKTLAEKIKSDTGMDVASKFDTLADDNGGKVTKDQFQAAMEKERPAGPPPGGAGRAQSASASADTSSSQDIAQFAQKMYEKFAQGLSQRVQGSNLSAVA